MTHEPRLRIWSRGFLRGKFANLAVWGLTLCEMFIIISKLTISELKEFERTWRSRVVRPSAHDWKSCIPHKGIEGSNPSFSAMSSQARIACDDFLCFVSKVISRLFRGSEPSIKTANPSFAYPLDRQKSHRRCCVCGISIYLLSFHIYCGEK